MMEEAFEDQKRVSQERLDTNKNELENVTRICLQRQTRVLNDLYDIFFSPENTKVYKQLLRLKIFPETK